MNFILNNGELIISNIKDEDRGRLARIEIAILKRIGTLKHDPHVDGTTRFTFNPDRTVDVRTALLEFCITPEA